jgi:hypothetical protein
MRIQSKLYHFCRSRFSLEWLDAPISHFCERGSDCRNLSDNADSPRAGRFSAIGGGYFGDA